VTGATSQWFAIEFTEDDDSIFPQDLSFTATLTSPPGETFQLFAYQGSLSGPDCTASANPGSSGSPSVIDLTWTDHLGSDDSLWFILEVRHVSTEACDPSATWSLTIEGDTG